jgi:P27 family predicted phage terminase small subunit
MAGNSNSGRRPQPTNLRVLRGNPGKRPIPAGEPTPPPVTSAFDVPPPDLDGDDRAAAEWRRLAPMLRACKLVTEAERTLLIALCQNWSRYLEAQDKIRKLGLLVKTPNGLPVVNPYLDIANKALAICRPLWVELGLTPAGRAKIHALPGDQTQEISKWDGLLSGVTDARNL